MILVIPALELRKGICHRQIVGAPELGSYYHYLQEHPDELARLLRQENARSLHIVDLDTLDSGDTMSYATKEAIRRICSAVDIPIELLTRFNTPDDCEYWLNRGVFRVVISGLVMEYPHHVEQLLQTYTASRIVLGIRANNRQVNVGRYAVPDTLIAQHARSLGIRRVIYSDVRWEGTYEGPDFLLVEEFGRATNMSITLAGGIDSPQELWQCQDLQYIGVDSVIVGRALFENRFPCQYIWRAVEAQAKKNLPLQKNT